ncbi:hypothetical protein GCM10027275_51800 [Rhabdobacter roseus]|uniref:Uncharacterized protein n=1 Tax=Rhabdobacter roseus TaxID=1655419 RepID=A0A840TWF0_9BACT|nr:hypothetical protein [Rhabdobacter roseus]MBB5287255.1 hypothetical protein [Rhabdobacter roseus]
MVTFVTVEHLSGDARKFRVGNDALLERMGLVPKLFPDEVLRSEIIGARVYEPEDFDETIALAGLKYLLACQ